MIVYLFIELLETSGKKSLKLSEKFVKTTSVINRKKNATRLLKADLVFNEQKIPTRKMMEQHHTSK